MGNLRQSHTIKLELSHRATKQLESLSRPLIVELEYYFSCLIRLKTYFPETPNKESLKLELKHDKILLYSHAVMSKVCAVSSTDGSGPELIDFPLKKTAMIIPRWLKLDYRRNQWSGEFG